MEFIFKHFEENFVLINEQHYANTEYWADATIPVKNCIDTILKFQEDQKKLQIDR